MTKRIILAVLTWLAVLYGAQAALLTFGGEVSSGGEPKGHAIQGIQVGKSLVIEGTPRGSSFSHRGECR